MYKSFSSRNILGNILLEREGFFMRATLTVLQNYKKTIAITAFLILVFISGNITRFPEKHISQTKVLGANTHSTPTPTSLPTPTVVPITIINNIILPTQIPTIPIQVSPTATPIPVLTTVPTAPTTIPTPGATSTPTPTPTVVSPTPTPTVTPVPQTVSISIDYAGEHAISTYSATITSNETAWQAVQDGVGLKNLHYKDYGGSLGIMITGFNGIDASTNQYFDFQINGTSSNVGVSSYIVNDHDMLKFVLTSF